MEPKNRFFNYWRISVASAKQAALDYIIGYHGQARSGRHDDSTNIMQRIVIGKTLTLWSNLLDHYTLKETLIKRKSNN